MRHDLLGLELEQALYVLEREGITAQVTTTSAPRRTDCTDAVLRVVYASDDGERLTVSGFVDPIARQAEENI